MKSSSWESVLAERGSPSKVLTLLRSFMVLMSMRPVLNSWSVLPSWQLFVQLCLLDLEQGLSLRMSAPDMLECLVHPVEGVGAV